MGVNHINLANGEELLDLRRDTIKKEVLVSGYTAHNSEGEPINGEMPNHEAVDKSIDGITETSYTIPKGYHNGEGTVKLTDDIANEVDSQTDIISQIKSVLQGKAAGGKQEQTKELNVTENGSYTVEPDEGYTLSGVGVNVDVEDDFIGIKYSNFSGLQYNLPKTADARSFDKILLDPNDKSIHSNIIGAENGHCLAYAFANTSANANGGYKVQLEEVYLPTKITALVYTFQNCNNLKRIIGDVSNIKTLNVTFNGCYNLEEIPYFPNLTTIGNQSFQNCNALKKYCVPPKVTSIHTGAFNKTPNLLDIYVAFAEGAISGAPWGATNATIHYNTQYDEYGNPIV